MLKFKHLYDKHLYDVCRSDVIREDGTKHVRVVRRTSKQPIRTRYLGQVTGYQGPVVPESVGSWEKQYLSRHGMADYYFFSMRAKTTTLFSTSSQWTFPSYGDPIFLALVVILSLPGILLNPIVIKSRITRISNSIPALLTTCLCGVYLVLGVFVSTSWIYFIVKDTPHQDFDVHPATGFDQVYSLMYCSGNLYSTALMYLMAFSRYRAIADPFDAVSYKEILRKAISFGIVTLLLCLGGATATVYWHRSLASKFKMLIIYSVRSNREIISWYIFSYLLMFALLISSLEHTWRTIKMLRKEDDTPVETREQRRNGVKMVPYILVHFPLVTQFPLHCGHAKTCLTFALASTEG
eukprot:sb/3466190/